MNRPEEVGASANSPSAIIRAVITTSVVVLLIFAISGCSSSTSIVSSSSASSNSSIPEPSSSSSTEPDSSDDSSSSSGTSYTGGWGLINDDLIQEFVDVFDSLESEATEQLEERRAAEPIHAIIGDEVQVTGNLAVSVVSVEPGPYDYADNTPTMKVTVAMRNLADKSLSVKPSNWDADNTSGQRIDHKIYVKDENGKRDIRSFEPMKISPGATATGVVYFDGDGLVDVIYEPHWLISAENQYVYFNVG